jgi:hypothetical protein
VAALQALVNRRRADIPPALYEAVIKACGCAIALHDRREEATQRTKALQARQEEGRRLASTIIEAWRDGQSVGQIAKALGLRTGAVQYQVDRDRRRRLSNALQAKYGDASVSGEQFRQLKAECRNRRAYAVEEWPLGESDSPEHPH